MLAILRSVLAILAGIIVLTIASFAIEAVVNPLVLRLFHDAIPNEDALNQNVFVKLFMLAYTMLCVACGGYVTAWLARRPEIAHAVIMGVIEAAMTVWVLAKLPTHAPVWSSIAGTALVIPAAWYGGWLWVHRAKLARNVARTTSV